MYVELLCTCTIQWAHIALFLVPLSAVSTSTLAESRAIAGETYMISCMVRKPDGLSAMPDITWINPDGVEVNSRMNSTHVGSTLVASSTVEFDPLLTSQSGVYTCQVSLSSPSFSLPLSMSAVVTVTVQSKLYSSHKFVTVLHWCYLVLVPLPTIEIFTTPESGPFYAGSILSMTCIADTDSVVDTPFTVNIVWVKSGEMLSNDYHISISNVTQLSSHVYQESIYLNPLSTTSDTGIYTCQVEIDSSPSLLYVQRAVHSNLEVITVQSKNCVERYLSLLPVNGFNA